MCEFSLDFAKIPNEYKYGIFILKDANYPLWTFKAIADIGIVRENPEKFGEELAMTASAMSMSNDRTKRRFQDVEINDAFSMSILLNMTMGESCNDYTCFILTFKDMTCCHALVNRKRLEEILRKELDVSQEKISQISRKELLKFSNIRRLFVNSNMKPELIQSVHVDIETSTCQAAIDLVYLLESTLS